MIHGPYLYHSVPLSSPIMNELSTTNLSATIDIGSVQVLVTYFIFNKINRLISTSQLKNWQNRRRNSFENTREIIKLNITPRQKIKAMRISFTMRVVILTLEQA